MENITTLLLIALAVGSSSFTVTFTGIFKGIREMVSEIHPKLEELIHCPWCFSHWVTFLFLFLTSYTYKFTDCWLANFALTTFAITAISGIIHYVLLRAYEPVAKAMVQRHIDKMKNQK
jgi:hypothetical protein